VRVSELAAHPDNVNQTTTGSRFFLPQEFILREILISSANTELDGEPTPDLSRAFW
jgi:hypothetical protein